MASRATFYHSCDPPLKPEIMKILFLRLFSWISRFLIESNFNSCKEILLKFRWFFLSKCSISVQKPAGWKKFSNVKCNFLSSASLRKAVFFSSKSAWPGLSEMIRYIGVPGRACLCQIYSQKTAKSLSFHLTTIFHHQEKSFILWEFFFNLCHNAQIDIPSSLDPKSIFH
jgi:hypothetical protein